MKIKKVRFKNGYKRFHDLTIDLGENPARIIALVGPNGCGKSSVLDGLLFHASAWCGIGSGPHRDIAYHSMRSAKPVDHTNVEIELVDGPYEVLANNRNASGNAQTTFSFRSPYRYNNQLKISETKSVEEIRLNNYGARDAASIDAKMESNYRRLYSDYDKYLNDKDVRPSEAKAKIVGDLNSSISRCLDLELFSLGSIERGQGTLFFKKNDHDQEFEFNVLSSGEKEVVDIIMDLYLRREDYNDTIFLIDEPELHINTSIQRSLLIEINRLIGDNCQLWITTHSIGFLRALQNDLRDQCQVIQFRSDMNLGSSARTILPVKPSPSLWRDLFTVALDDLANLVSPELIIYCEGRAEPDRFGSERGLDAKVYNIVFGGLFPGTLFVSSGGNTELDQRSAIAIAVLSKVFTAIEIRVLKDRDSGSGQPISDHDRTIYLKNNPSNHRMLRRWEIENYLYDKEVLESYCTSNGLNFNHAAFEEFVLDIKNQNLKDATGRIKSICGIKTSISADSFKIGLAEFILPGMNVYTDLFASIFE